MWMKYLPGPPFQISKISTFLFAMKKTRINILLVFLEEKYIFLQASFQEDRQTFSTLSFFASNHLQSVCERP